MGRRNALSLRLFLVPALAAALWGCSGTDAPEDPEVPERSRLEYSAGCQRDTLRIPSSGAWTVEGCPEWVTLPFRSAEGDIVLPIYVQENGSEAAREGEILISHHGDRQLRVSVTQNPDDNNGGGCLLNLPRDFGLGWGYDVRQDYADTTGIRQQVFDAAAIKNVFGETGIFVDYTSGTNLVFQKAESSEDLQQKIGGMIEGGVDLKVASAKVSVEYENQISEHRDALYVWCRDYRCVKSAYFNNDFECDDPEMVQTCTTDLFRKSVENDTPQEFVRKYGSHVVVRSYLGGKLDYYFTVSHSVRTEVESIVTTINVKLLFFKKEFSHVDEKVWTEIKDSFEGKFAVAGGGETGKTLNLQLAEYAGKGQPLVDEDIFNRWYSLFSDPRTAADSDLSMIEFEVVPIWEVVEALSPAKASAIHHYLLEK